MTASSPLPAPVDAEPTPTRLFASAADAPRVRRPNDWLVAATCLLVAVLAGWAASSRIAIDARVAVAFGNTPSWLDFLARVAYAGAGVYTAVIVVLIVIGGGKRAIRRDVLIALVSVSTLATLASRAASGEWPDLVPEFVDPGDGLSYPVVRLALLTAVLSTAAPHLTLPVRTTGRRVVVACAVAGIVLGVASLTGIVGALAIGRGVAAVVHLVHGSPAGLPSNDRLAAALGRLGFPDATVELLPHQPGGGVLVRATIPGGEQLLVKVHGRDAADAELAAKLWRGVWYRDVGPTLSLTGLQQVEHEAVATLLAERQGVAVAPILTVGQDVDENAFLVTAWPREATLDELGEDGVTDTDIDRCWSSLGALHRGGIAHGSISPETLRIGDDQVTLADLSQASLAATDARLQSDVAALLASHVVSVGIERAVAGALRNLDPDRLESVLPYLQDAVLRPDLRRRLRKVADFSDVVDRLLEGVDVEKPPMAEVRRVQLGDVVLVVFGIFAANAILSQIAQIGFDTLVEELRGASFAWLLTGFVLGLAGYFGDVISIRGAVGRPVPLAPALLLQSAKRFIGLAVPSMAGRVALDVRFLQKSGVPTSTALAQGPLIGFMGFLAEVVILLLGAWAIGQEFDTDELSDGNAGVILTLAVAVVVIGVVVLVALPGLRAKVLPPVVEAVRSVSDVIRDPRRLGRIFGGQFLDRVLTGLSLAATLAAFDVRLSFAAVLFVAVGTGLLAGLAPVPGGIGVAEATMTALLTGVGVEPEIAFAVAITYRLITSYLPPVLGWFSLRWLTGNGYL